MGGNATFEIFPDFPVAQTKFCSVRNIIKRCRLIDAHFSAEFLLLLLLLLLFRLLFNFSGREKMKNFGKTFEKLENRPLLLNRSRGDMSYGAGYVLDLWELDTLAVVRV